MHWSPDSDVIGVAEMELDCLQILNSPKHVGRVVRLVATARDKDIETVCSLCHCILSRMRQAVHSNRSLFYQPVVIPPPTTTSCLVELFSVSVRLLYTLAFNNGFIRSLWHLCTSICEVNSAGCVPLSPHYLPYD